MDRCVNSTCPNKEKCGRWMVERRPFQVSNLYYYLQVDGKFSCEWYVPLGELGKDGFNEIPWTLRGRRDKELIALRGEDYEAGDNVE